MADEEYSPRGPVGERRRAPRIEVQGRLTVKVLSSTVRPIRLVNFSAGGLSVTSPEEFMPGEVHRIMVRSGPTEAPVFKAQVIYWRPVATNPPSARYLVGFTFIGMGESQRAHAARLLEELAKADSP